jgi:hypothetical protein
VYLPMPFDVDPRGSWRAPNSFNKRSHGTSVAVALPRHRGPSNQILIVINSPGWIDI